MTKRSNSASWFPFSRHHDALPEPRKNNLLETSVPRGLRRRDVGAAHVQVDRPVPARRGGQSVGRPTDTPALPGFADLDLQARVFTKGLLVDDVDVHGPDSLLFNIDVPVLAAVTRTASRAAFAFA